ncbi:MAG TPA: PKD domain-containing protein [Gemmatimonadales bacterium]|nr:PKD domain-containing protein [Gemmatimonadales bacterium]
MIARTLVRMCGVFLLVVTVTCGGPNEPRGNLHVTLGTLPSVPLAATFALPVTFSDSSNQGPWSYSINWGDGNSSTGSVGTQGALPATHTYTNNGNYRVDVSVTNARDANGSASLNLTTGDPVILAAGDIGDCLRTSDDATGQTLDTIPGIVMPLGDNAYLDGTPEEYANCYDPAWGRQKYRTRPVAGNHDYNTSGAAGYYGYFGAAAGDPTKGYYSFTAGSWFVLVINTGTDRPVNYEAGSPQEQWIRAELAAHTEQCTLAVWHHPRFSTIKDRAPIRPEVTAIWNALYEYGVDLVLNGHDHSYQRFAPQKPDGTLDNAFGIPQIVVGTGGGEGLYAFGPIPEGSNSEVRNNDTWGVLKLTLKNAGYDWRFIRSAGGTFTDSGSGTCHGRPQ